MNDITPKEAIANLNRLYGMVAPDIQRSLDAAIKALERPQGDLISREALRKEVTEKVNFTTVDGHIAYDKMLKLIDNAPTVNTNAIADNEKSQGDLISREALKDITYINKGNFNTVEGIREWIDNAPTVAE